MAHTEIGTGGFEVPFETPTIVSDGGPADGFIDAEPTNDTPPQSFAWSLMIDGAEIALESSNGLHTGWNWGTIPKGAKCKLRGVPLDLQRNAKGGAAVVVQLSAPGRGQAKYSF